MKPIVGDIESVQYALVGRIIAAAILSSLFQLLLLATTVWSAEPLRVGILLSTSGTAESLGKDALMGIRLAHAAKPTVLGRRVEIVFADAGSDPVQATCAMFRLVERDSVSFVIGDVMSVSTIAASPCAERNRVPLISLVGMPSCVARSRRFTFWSGVSDKIEAGGAAMVCRVVLGAHTAAVICDKSEDFSVTVAHEFRKSFVRMGGRIVYESYLGTGGCNGEDRLKRAGITCPDVLFAPLSAVSAASVARYGRNLGLATPILTTGRAEHQELIETGGHSVEGMYLLCRAARSPGTKTSEDGSVEGAQSIPERSPASWAAVGSEAYRALLKAMECARSTDAEKVCAALARKHRCPSSANGNRSRRDLRGVGLVLKRVESGRFIVISDSAMATRSEICVTTTAERQGAFDHHTGNIKANASWKTRPFFPVMAVK